MAEHIEREALINRSDCDVCRNHEIKYIVHTQGKDDAPIKQFICPSALAVVIPFGMAKFCPNCGAKLDGKGGEAR